MVPGFGASDCGCDSHLVHFPTRPGSAITAPAVLQRIRAIFKALNGRYENHAVRERDPFRTLVKCILSLRTRDPVTDSAARRLFQELRTPHEFASGNPDRISELTYPVGMYRQKALRLTEIAQQILSEFDGKTPSDVEALVTLPGVGRKTANLVRSFAFHLPAICVDTHVHRITNRWGLVRTVAPDDTECELRSILPEQYWIEINPLLVQHGQQICRPTRPRCEDCFLREFCGYERLSREQELLANLPGAPSHPSLHFPGM